MPVPSRTRRPRRPIVTIAALSFLAVLVMAPAFARGLTVDDVAKVVAVTDAEISPDGAYVAFVRSVPRDPYADDDAQPGRRWCRGKKRRELFWQEELDRHILGAVRGGQ